MVREMVCTHLSQSNTYSFPVKEGGRHGGRGRSWVGWLDLPGTEGDWPLGWRTLFI